MKFVTVTELKLKATQVVSEIESSKEEVVVTKNGKPVVIMTPYSANKRDVEEVHKELEELKKVVWKIKAIMTKKLAEQEQKNEGGFAKGEKIW
jgi:prevent-host-death family protein